MYQDNQQYQRPQGSSSSFLDIINSLSNLRTARLNRSIASDNNNRQKFEAMRNILNDKTKLSALIEANINNTATDKTNALAFTEKTVNDQLNAHWKNITPMSRYSGSGGLDKARADYQAWKSSTEGIAKADEFRKQLTAWKEYEDRSKSLSTVNAAYKKTAEILDGVDVDVNSMGNLLKIKGGF